jgi:excisionase family DNA binding protein
MGRRSLVNATETIVSLEEPLLDAEQAAALLNVKPSWVREATRSRRLPHIKVGKHVRYTRPMLEAWVARQRASGPRAG